LRTYPKCHHIFSKLLLEKILLSDSKSPKHNEIRIVSNKFIFILCCPKLCELRNNCSSYTPAGTQAYICYRTRGPVTGVQGNIPRVQIIMGKTLSKFFRYLCCSKFINAVRYCQVVPKHAYQPNEFIIYMRKIYGCEVHIYLTSQEIPRPIPSPQGHYRLPKDVQCHSITRRRNSTHTLKLSLSERRNLLTDSV